MPTISPPWRTWRTWRADYGLSLCQRQQLPATLIALDLDGLKTINDSLGHAAGDALIRQVAELLSGAFRQSDLFARLGGDEFVVFLANATARGPTRRWRPWN